MFQWNIPEREPQPVMFYVEHSVRNPGTGANDCSTWNTLRSQQQAAATYGTGLRICSGRWMRARNVLRGTMPKAVVPVAASADLNVPRGTFLLPAGWTTNGLRLTSGLFYVEHLGRREPARNRPVALFHVEHSADGQTSGTKRACRPETVWRRVHNVLRGTSAR